MSKNGFGNNLLHLLSEKQFLSREKFIEYVQVLKEHSNISNELNYPYWRCSLDRNLSALGYLDIGVDEQGNKIVQIAPPMLVELPFMQLSLLLTGARSPAFIMLLKNITRNSGIAMDIIPHKYLPDTIFIKPENKSILQSLLENTIFQGDKLSSFIKISDRPVAWNILDFSGNLDSYEESLRNEWFSGSESNISQIFDTNSLKLKNFQHYKDNLINSKSLVRVFHSEHFYKYYLFSKNNGDMVAVDLDWGRFLISKQSEHQILKYNKKTFELSSTLRFPTILERGLTLFSGYPPKREGKNFTFRFVPEKVANVVGRKLKQNIYVA